MVLSSALDSSPDGGRDPSGHAHDFVQVHYVDTGQHVLHVDGRDLVLRAGEALVIAPGAVIATPARTAERDCGMWTLLFSLDTPFHAMTGAIPSLRTYLLLSPFVDTGPGGHRITLPLADRERWLAQLVDLRTELRERRDGYADAVRAHLTLLLLRLSRLDPDTPVGRDREDVVSDVLRFVDTRYQDPISPKDVADAVARSSGHLTTVVKQHTGRTVGQWITQRRMREARRLLADSDLTISDIAARTGYRDPGYFTRRFRAEHDVAPLAWRRAGQTERGTSQAPAGPDRDEPTAPVLVHHPRG